MLASVLPFSPELADRVSEYCEKLSKALPKNLDKRWESTIRTYADADMMSSKLQGQWMIWMGQWIQPKRVLEIGTYTGFSALAWYEGTRSTKSEIITIDLPGHVLEQTKDFFKEMGADDRIRVMEGSGNQELPKLSGEFELIFLDADKHNQRNYINIILEKRLLAPKGVILVDNIFSRGLTMGNEFNPHLDKTTRPLWEAHGEALREFNKFLIDDPRIDVLMLPLFDGVTQIQWNLEYLQTLENERSRGSTGV